MRLSIYESYDELKVRGYDYRINNDGVTNLLIEMDELGITGYVDTVGNVNTFWCINNHHYHYTYEDFMGEILVQGLLNIQLVKDTARGRSYYQCNSMFTLTALEV